MSQIAEHENGLGYIVLYGTTDRQHVTYEEAQAMIVKHGLNAELQPPTRARACSRAVAERKSQDRITLNVGNDAKQRVVRFYRPEKDTGTEEVQFPAEDRVVFDKATETITVEGEHKEEIESSFEHFAAHVTGDDIRQLARDVVERLDGVSLRGSVDVQDAGGTYFVPMEHRGQLQALADVLEDLRVGYLRVFGVIRGPQEQLQVALQAEFSIEQQIADIHRLVSKLTKRVSSAVSYRKQLERLAKLLRDYSALAGRTAPAELQRKLDRAIAAADAKIAELTPKSRKKRRVRKAA